MRNHLFDSVFLYKKNIKRFIVYLVLSGEKTEIILKKPVIYFRISVRKRMVK